METKCNVLALKFSGLNQAEGALRIIAYASCVMYQLDGVSITTQLKLVSSKSICNIQILYSIEITDELPVNMTKPLYDAR